MWTEERETSPSDPRSAPAVTVIIPTFNRESFLARAIDSVLVQTHRNFELIVVDDGSSDATASLVASYGGAVRYLFQENRGPAAARNLGIREARHGLLAFLDADDHFHPGKLAMQVQAMEARPELFVSHTQETWYRNGRHLNQKLRHRKEGGDIFARSLELCVVGMSTVMVRRELFARIGLFDESFPCCEDYDLWLRASVAHEFLLVDAPLTVKHGGRSDQVSVQHRVGMDRFRIRSLEKLLAAAILSPSQRALAGKALAGKATIYGNGCLKHGRREEGLRYLALAAGVASSPPRG